MISKDIFNLIGKNKKYIFITIFLMVLSLFLNIVFTGLISYTFYSLYKVPEISKNYIKYINIAFFLFSSILVKYSLSILIGHTKDKITKSLKKDLRNKVFLKTERLGFDATNKFSMSTITQMSIEGIEQLDMYFTIFIPQLFYSMIAPIILFVISVFLNYKVAITLLLIVPFIPGTIMAFAKKAKNIVNKYMDKYYHLGDTFYDSVSGLNELLIFKADTRYEEMMENSASDFRKITMRVLVIQLVSLTLMDIIAFGGAGIGISLALLDASNNVSLIPNILPKESAIYQGFFLVLLAIEFFIPLRILGSAFHISLNGVNSGKKIIEFLNIKENSWGDKSITNGEIEFQDVSFSYDGKKNVLNNLNLNFKKNTLTTIVGNSGSGKSTILKLILGSYLPTYGNIKIDNILIHDLSKDNYFHNLVFVSSDTYLFNDTIKNNFKISNPNIDDNKIYELLKKVDLYDFVKNDKDGLDKIILEDSKNISGGQKQRLALAISLALDKRIYIFDEATSNIDSDSEKIITDNIKNLSKNKTVIFVTHRLINCLGADNIYFIENGKLIESGCHNKLLEKNGLYKKMFVEQLKLENYEK